MDFLLIGYHVNFCAAFPSYVIVGIGTSLAVLVAALASFSISRKGQLSWVVYGSLMLLCLDFDCAF